MYVAPGCLMHALPIDEKSSVVVASLGLSLPSSSDIYIILFSGAITRGVEITLCWGTVDSVLGRE